jgi:hypothetical protein
MRQAMDLPKEEWNLVDLSRELHLGPFEAKKLEVSLKIFQGGGYRIKRKPAPEPKPRKPKAEAHVAPAKKDRADEAEEPEEDETEDEAETRKPAAPKGPSKAAEGAPAKCATHHAPGLERHACGAWLCRACLDAGGTCEECHMPLVPADREARKKDRQADFGRL